MKNFKPMLAGKVDDLTKLSYPLYGSPKLDGIRAMVQNNLLVTRSLKLIPNHATRGFFSGDWLNGADGELIVGDPRDGDVFRKTDSGVMSHDGDPQASFYVFDHFGRHDSPFINRHRTLSILHGSITKKNRARVVMVPQVQLDNADQAANLEQLYLAEGYEGLMLRDPRGQYKFGRSTLRQAWLLKVKQFLDSEAEILGVEELQTNTNEAKINNLGHKERSSAKAGKIAGGTLGALIVMDLRSKIIFNIGTGFTAADRQLLWELNAKGTLVGRIVKYKYFPTGSKEKPRFPVFHWFRDELDLS